MALVLSFCLFVTQSADGFSDCFLILTLGATLRIREHFFETTVDVLGAIRGLPNLAHYYKSTLQILARKTFDNMCSWCLTFCPINLHFSKVEFFNIVHLDNDISAGLGLT